MRKSVAITYVAFFISLVILLGIGFNFYTRLLRYNYSITWIEHTHEVLHEIRNFENYFKEIESSQRGFLLTGDSVFLKSSDKKINSIKLSFKRLLQLTSDNPTQQKNLGNLNYLISRRLDILEEAIVLHTLDRTLFKKRLIEGREAMDNCAVILSRMEKEEQRLLVMRRKIKDTYGTSSSNYSVVIFIFSFVVFIITFLLIIRELSRRFRYQRDLELKITELNQANAELEQITFAASHDLQEPLRKIMTFSDMLKVKYTSTIPAEAQRLVERLQLSATRMHGLVDDLMSFTRLAGIKEEPQKVSLKEVVEEVQYNFKDVFAAKDAQLSIDLKLPVITGYYNQLGLLFHALIDNAVKFSRDNVAPVIFILTQDATAEEMAEKFKIKHDHQRYIKVIIRDNGIGFDDEFAGKVFNLFQRLHAQETVYKGKGIGLTIVKRIMTNHLGFVTAHGKINEGAEFTLYFPVS
ncbi:sensor histidine kinase [Ohtaekwangia koreensis]|uniref:histidine kinase n=1 Tax=Ohtaekwangia koreensis TaxID=688867 RepID=A0A1T5LBI9_9BACT|nr:sensor histidine kinase [Ohtaekwangia koreensis]SKC73406.1 Histidine kinase-, DNA gyrase B-, and HSP90-like ATPase [Ohtaekwangia koreensis]